MGSLSQGLLPFDYEADRSENGLTNLAGAGAYLDLMEGAGVGEAIDREVGLRRDGQGWTDRQVVRSLMLLGLSGGECVEDLRMLEEDAGLGRLLRRVERRGGRRQRREQRRRWRREKTRTVPSPGLVTNLTWDGRAVIEWYRQRCGKGEEVHAVMKEDLAGGTLPSARFGANVAWWWIMLLALNLNQVMKQLVLGGPWVRRRLKAIRFHLLCLPARIVDHANRLRIRLGRGHCSLALLIQARRRISDLAAAAP